MLPRQRSCSSHRRVASFIAVAVLTVVHIGSSKLHVPQGQRSRWLSVAGGVSVAYVFLHLMPSVANASERISLPFEFHSPAFALAFAGLLFFYGLTVAAQRSRRDSKGGSTSPAVFWLHLASFTIYNAVIGYILRTEERESLALFTIAMALHFAVVDYGLEADHREPYRRYGRWIVVAAITSGWALSYVTEVGRATTDGMIAFLAGGIVLNVLKEELPEERQSRFFAFAAGALAYGGLFLLM